VTYSKRSRFLASELAAKATRNLTQSGRSVRYDQKTGRYVVTLQGSDRAAKSQTSLPPEQRNDRRIA